MKPSSKEIVETLENLKELFKNGSLPLIGLVIRADDDNEIESYIMNIDEVIKFYKKMKE